METITAYIAANPFEIVGAVLTIWCVWLNTKENVWGWIIGIISTICYIYVFFNVDLIGDTLLHIYFLVTGVYGWYHWQFGDRTKPELPVTRTPVQYLLLIIGLGAIGALLLGQLFSTYPGAAIPYIDAVPVSYSLIAQWMLARKKLENWLLWVFVNVISTGIYFYKGLFVSSVLYIILLVLAVKGYLDWKQSLRDEESAAEKVRA